MKKVLLIISTILLLASLALGVQAHSGKTDGDGGHYDRSTGEYHYHHGYSAHSHYDMDGDGDVDCPYDFENKANPKKESSDVDKSEIRSDHYEDNENAISTDKELDPVTFLDVLKAMLSSLLPAICIFFASSYLLFYVFLLFLGENKGCSVSIILGAVISLIAYVWLIIARIT